MSGDVHVRICERLGGRFPGATRPQVYVGTRAAGERVMASLQCFIEGRLRLKVNAAKSAVDKPWKRSFLGLTFSRRGAKVKVADKAIDRLKAQLRTLSRRTRGHRLSQVIGELREILLGWKAYFDLSEVLSPLRDLDKWLRRRLRCYQWKQWGRAGYRELRKRGVSRDLAWNTSKSAHGPWRISHSPALYLALPTRYFRGLGLPELAARSLTIEPPWYVIRMPGGVGGEAPRGPSLSRLGRDRIYSNP